MSCVVSENKIVIGLVCTLTQSVSVVGWRPGRLKQADAGVRQARRCVRDLESRFKIVKHL